MRVAEKETVAREADTVVLSHAWVFSKYKNAPGVRFTVT